MKRSHEWMDSLCGRLKVEVPDGEHYITQTSKVYGLIRDVIEEAQADVLFEEVERQRFLDH